MSDEQEVTRIIGDDEFNPAVGTTRLILLVDRTGSMQGRAKEVVDGLNEFVTEQRTGPDRATLTVILFNISFTVPTNGPVQDAPLFMVAPRASRANRVAASVRSSETGLTYGPNGEVLYDPDGGTALYDAILDAIAEGEKLMEPDDRVLVLIQTDGQENSSKATLETVKEAIAKKVATNRWTFTYMGADIDAWQAEVASPTMGAQASLGNSVAYNVADPRVSWSAMNTSVSGYRGMSTANTKNFYTIPDDETPDDPNVPATP